MFGDSATYILASLISLVLVKGEGSHEKRTSCRT